MHWTSKPMSPKQESFINTLAAERDVDDKVQEFFADERTMGEASDLISWLKRQPRTTAQEGLDLTNLPAGRYAAINPNTNKMTFLKVDKPDEQSRWHGHIFVKLQVSDNFEWGGRQRPNERYQGQLTEVLKVVMKDPKAASERYGHELGICGVCGRTLTNPESIARGMGDICAGKWGA